MSNTIAPQSIANAIDEAVRTLSRVNLEAGDGYQPDADDEVWHYLCPDEAREAMDLLDTAASELRRAHDRIAHKVIESLREQAE